MDKVIGITDGFTVMNIDEIKDKKIAVLLSGGVDSSVVVYEFARHGLHPDCFYIKIGPEEQEEWDCSCHPWCGSSGPSCRPRSGWAWRR